MNFSALSDPTPKPWCNINCNTISAESMNVINNIDVKDVDALTVQTGSLLMDQNISVSVPIVGYSLIYADNTDRINVSSQTQPTQQIAYLSDIPIIPGPFQDNNIISNDSLTKAECLDGDIFTLTNSTGSKINITPSVYELNNINSSINLSLNPDGSSQANTTYISATNGINNAALAVTGDSVLLVKDSLPRLIIDNDFNIKDASNNERLVIQNNGYTSLRTNSTSTRLDLDNDGSFYVASNGNVAMYVNPTNQDTRIWSPDMTSVLGIENNNGIKINGQYYMPNNQGTINQVLTSTGSTGTTWATPQLYGLYSATGAPVTVANTTTQSSLIPTGVGSLTVPPGTVTAGMSYLLKCGGTFRDNVNNTQITFRLTNSGTLFSTGLLTLNSVPLISTGWSIDTQFTYTGGTQLITNFTFSYNSGSDGRGFTSQQVNNTFNPLVSNTLNFTIQWATANINNTITCNFFTLTKIF